MRIRKVQVELLVRVYEFVFAIFRSWINFKGTSTSHSSPQKSFMFHFEDLQSDNFV